MITHGRKIRGCDRVGSFYNVIGIYLHVDNSIGGGGGGIGIS